MPVEGNLKTEVALNIGLEIGQWLNVEMPCAEISKWLNVEMPCAEIQRWARLRDSFWSQACSFLIVSVLCEDGSYLRSTVGWQWIIGERLRASHRKSSVFSAWATLHMVYKNHLKKRQCSPCGFFPSEKRILHDHKLKTKLLQKKVWWRLF